jgi:hypothetical protein
MAKSMIDGWTSGWFLDYDFLRLHKFNVGQMADVAVHFLVIAGRILR